MTKFQFKFVSSLTDTVLSRERPRSKSELDRLQEEGWTIVGKGICGKGEASVGHWLKREVVPGPALDVSSRFLPRWTSNLFSVLKPQRRD